MSTTIKEQAINKHQLMLNKSLNSFSFGTKPTLDEIYRFNEFLEHFEQSAEYGFENIHLAAQNTEAQIQRTTGEYIQVVNMANYNYLGFSSHREVINAAKEALDLYGLGAGSAPLIGGTLAIHKQLEDKIRDCFGTKDHGVSLFSSGYNVNIGTISAIMRPGTHIFVDQCIHMSIVEGAKLSGAHIHFYEHNNYDHLEELLKSVNDNKRRKLICTEGIYSADGDFGDIKRITEIAKQYGAMTLVDEAHSALVAGKNGLGVSELQGVLHEVDFYVMTFSKAFGGIGGAVLTKREIARYINYYARCRMFSCAIDPAISGGVLKVLELATSEEGERRRKQLHANASYLKSLLANKVDMLNTESWIIPIIYGDDKNSNPLNDFIQRQGLEVGLMTFPAVPRGQSRLRLFVTSQHTEEQLNKAADIILAAAQKFNFLLKGQR